MRQLLIPLSFLLLSLTTFAQTETYSKAKIYLDGHTLNELGKLGIEIEHGLVKKGVFIETDLSVSEIARVQTAGFRVEISIPDVARYYSEQNLTGSAQKTGNRLCTAPQYDVPQNFHLGSMGGYLTYQEMLNNLDSMAAKFPTLITKRAVIDSTLPTVGGKLLYWTHITSSNGPAHKPQMLYTALHHAREPLSLSQLVYYMYYLLERYDTDSSIHYLLDNVDLYFIPCVNPDGYLYNQATNPNGGGMWRKNRVDNHDGTYGVDINRNYGFNWGYDDLGSSPNTSDETYRGSSAFSEPETKSVRNFAIAHNFRITLNYHTFGGYVVYPWGYEASLLTPDSIFFDRMGSFITSENRYIYGTGNLTVGYNTNGDSDDWMYGEQVTKGKIFSMTPEVGTSFWDAQADIIPVCKLNVFQNLQTARLLLPRALVTDINPIILEKDTGYLHFEVTRLGLPDSIDYTLTLTPITTGLHIMPVTRIYTNMALAELRTDSFQYTIDTNGRSNNNVSFIATISGGGVAYSDTFTKFYGGLTIVFNEPCNNLSKWTTNDWGLTNDHVSAPTGFTDSPNSNYPDQSDLSITMDTIIDLTHATNAYLTFSAKWDIETSFDYSQVLASVDGTTWTPLCGQYTHIGGVYQATFEPLYDGHNPNWVNEFIDLSDYAGHSVKLQFKTVSDQAVDFDGFVFDDLKIWANAACTPLPSAILPTTDSVIVPGVDSVTLHAQTSVGAVYQWLHNGSPINGATDSVYIATAIGTYSVITSNGNNCPVTSATQVIKAVPTGVNPLGNHAEISVSPNPFSTSLNVKVSLDKAAAVDLSIKDLLGRTLTSKTIRANAGDNSFTLELNGNIAAGVYLLSAQSVDVNYVVKVVKN